MVKNIEVSAFLKELGDDKTGMSKPLIILGDDGEQYILKNQNVYDERVRTWVIWDCMFLQELLVFNIAKYLELKIPECVIVKVDNEFLTNAPSLTFQHRYSTGYHFGSKLVDSVENNILNGYRQLIQMRKPYVRTSWNAFFKKIVNIDDIPKIVVLDLLTANFDRFGNNGNLMIAKENGKRYIYAIDHGHCFYGPSWNNIEKRRRLLALPDQTYISSILQTFLKTNGNRPMSGLGEIFRAIDQHIDISNPVDHSFINVVEKVENINEHLIDTWLKDIPEEWFVDKQVQIPVYKKFILQQKDIIHILINQMAQFGAFHSHTGGELEWKRTGTQ